MLAHFAVGCALVGSVAALGCAVADKSAQVYVFGAPYGDANLGASPSDWGSGTGITPLNNLPLRPAFDTANPFCAYAPYLDYFVFLNVDSSAGLSALHVFDVTSKAWTVVPLTGADLPSGDDLVATVDHDTNVIYAYSKGQIYRIGDAGDINLAKLASTPRLTMNWLSQFAVTTQPFDGANYKAVFGQGTNHLHFFNAPGLAAGEAWIFVVHYAWWQPTAQSYGSFPQLPGQSVYIPVATGGAPPVFAYIPDNGQATLLVDTKANSTTSQAGFGQSGPTFRYAATAEQLIQYDGTTGNLNVMQLGSGAVSKGTGLGSLPKVTGAAPVVTSTVTVSGVAGTASAQAGSSSSVAAASSKSGASQAAFVGMSAMLVGLFLL
ncbi:hypothetical protein HDU81_008085 [Chytriomyces hyalinus]|nr:hypothetical protein HDU81_008085 [Chytriomyces hyalinus]